MMVTRNNPFEDKSYEKLIQNNLRGYVDTSVLAIGPNKITTDRKVLDLIQLQISSDRC
jgi:hypothetical protein